MRERMMRSREPADRPSRATDRFPCCVGSGQPPLIIAWRTSSKLSDRSNGAASDVDLTRFDARIIRATQSSGRPRHDG
jgi:hypothetical protein